MSWVWIKRTSWQWEQDQRVPSPQQQAYQTLYWAVMLSLTPNNRKRDSPLLDTSETWACKGFRLKSEVIRLTRSRGRFETLVYLLTKPEAHLHVRCEEKNADTQQENLYLWQARKREGWITLEGGGGGGGFWQLTTCQLQCFSHLSSLSSLHNRKY